MTALTLRTRLTIWYTLAVVIAVALFGANVLRDQGRLGLRRMDRKLDAMGSNVANIVRDSLAERNDPRAAAEEARRAVTLDQDAIAVLDGAGVPIAASWHALKLKDPLPTAGAGNQVWTVEMPNGQWRVHAMPKRFGDETLVILVASSLADVRLDQHEVLEAMEVAIPLVLLLAGGGGFWLASAGLRPITEMAARATDMPLAGLDDLGHNERVDELGQLARAFNGLVARLRAALQAQQQFMADASHELRTPVSIVRTAADVGLSRDRRDEADYRETLMIVGDQARRLSRLVENMLILARADAGGYPVRPVDLYLDEVLTECCRAVDVLSKKRRVAIHKSEWPEVPFRGDEELLGELMLNVLQNAVQHTPEGGSVSIDLQQAAGRVSIRVTDTGPGIPPADHARIFDRFVQLDHARRGMGAGLGLPIARWIAELHHGTLVLERSGPSGSTFHISLTDAA